MSLLEEELNRYIGYTDSNGDDKVFVFNLPVRSGDSEVEVQILKHYLGMGGLDEVDEFFDVKTEILLKERQEQLRQRIEANGNFLPGEMFSERGQLGRATFLAFCEDGFLASATEILSDPRLDAVIFEPDPDDVGTIYDPQLERQQPPVRRLGPGNKETIFYTLITGFPREQKDQFFQERGHLFRQAVLNVFNYYGKSTTWEIDGQQRTPLLNPIYNLFGDENDFARQKYEELVIKTGRGTQFSENQTYKFTVERPGQLSEQITQAEIDVLFLQGLAEGAYANFANIHKITAPSNRPSSKFKITISIRTDLFDLIPGTTSRGGTIDITDPQVWQSVKDGFDQYKNFVEGGVDSLNRPFTKDFWDDRRDNLNKYVDSKKRKLEKSAKKAASNYWSKAKAGEGGLSDEERDRFLDKSLAEENAARIKRGSSTPVTKLYRINQIIERIDFVAKEMEKYPVQIVEFIERNTQTPRNQFHRPQRPITPEINFEEEIREFKLLKNVLSNFLEINGRTLRVGPNSDEHLLIFFRPVIKKMPIVVPEDDIVTPRLDSRRPSKPTEYYDSVVGYEIVQINHSKSESGEGDTRLFGEVLEAGIENFRNEFPFNSPTVVAYLMDLEEIFQQLKSASKDCDDVRSVAALEFLGRFHYPRLNINIQPKGLSNRPGQLPLRRLINLDINIDRSSLLTAAQELEEAQFMVSQSIENLKRSTFFDQKGKVINTKDVLPQFGEISCDIDQMFREFINRWDLNFLLCEYTKCVPNIGPWNLSFNWAIPSFPQLRPFDPLNFVMPQIKISLENIIMNFLCNFVKRVLETIRYPDCEELLRFGVLALSELNKEKEEDPLRAPFENAEERLSLLEKTLRAIEAMNIPRSSLSGETEDTIAALMDHISSVLTPYELCSLLEGSPTEETLSVVKNVIATKQSIIRKYLSTESEIKKFFYILGTVIEPYFCERIKELTESGDLRYDPCSIEDETIEGRIRSTLANGNASEEEIQNALKDAEKRKEIFDKLAQTGDFSSLLPELSNAGLAGAGISSPENNPAMQNSIRKVMQTVAANAKSYYNLEINQFVDNVVNSEDIKLIQPGEFGFNSYDYILFKYYLNRLDNLEGTQGKLHEPIGIFARPLPINGVLSPQQKSAFEEIGIDESEWDFMEYTIDIHMLLDSVDEERQVILRLPSGNPNAATTDANETRLLLSDIVNTYITSYVTKYSVRDQKVLPELFKFLDKYPVVSKQTLDGIYTRPTPIDIAGQGNDARLQSILIYVDDSVAPNANGQGPPNPIEFFGNYIGYHEMPFIRLPQNEDGGVKDCYKVNIPFDQNADGIYYEIIPDLYVQKRKEQRDVASQTHDYKLLRSGGFAELILESYQNMIETMPRGLRRDGVPSPLRSQLQGFMDEVFHPGDNSKNQPSLYSSYVNSFVRQIALDTKKSLLFNLINFQQFGEILGRRYVINRDEIDPCWIKNPKALDFELFVKQLIDTHSNLMKSSKQLTDRDYTINGNIENSIISNLFKFYIGLLALEKCLKSCFMFSNFGSDGVLSQQMTVEYIVKSVSDSILIDLGNDRVGQEVKKLIREITLEEFDPPAIRKLVTLNLDFEVISKFVSNFSELGYKSFRQKFYTDIVKNLKEVPSVDNYPKIAVQPNFLVAGQRNPRDLFGFEILPLSHRIPNLYEQFRFDGYDRDMIELKLNSGHFWVEKYYKIQNFETFFERYQQLRTQVNSRDSQGTTHLPFIGEDLSTSLYSEYISPQDFSILLFGGTQTESRAIEDRNELIRGYTKMIMLKFLTHHFNRKTRLSARLGMDYHQKFSKYFRLMQYLGMSRVNLIRHAQDGNVNTPTEYEILRFPTLQKRKDHIPANIDESNVDEHIADQAFRERIADEYGDFGDEISDLDFNLNSGAVTKDEIISRIVEVVGLLEGTLTADLPNLVMPQFIPEQYNNVNQSCREFMTNDSEIDLKSFGRTGETLRWLYRECFDKSNQDVAAYASINTQDKSRIITEILSVFVELSLNWPTNGYGQRNWQNNVRLTRPDGGMQIPVIRDRTVAFNMPTEVMRAIVTSKLSYEYVDRFFQERDEIDYRQYGGWYNHNEDASNPRDPEPTILIEDNNGNDTPFYPTEGFDYDNSQINKGDAREFEYSPAYIEGDQIQELILNYYIDRIGAARFGNLTSNSFAAGIFNLAKTLDEQLCDELQIKQFLNENVKCGYRLMTGHKMVRDDNLGDYEPGTYPEQSETTLRPDFIYNRLKPVIPPGPNNPNVHFIYANNPNSLLAQIGLENQVPGQPINPYYRNILSRKKAFIGYAESQNVVIEGSDLLNSDSVFYDNALAAIAKNQQGEFFNDELVRGIPPIPPGFRETMVYSLIVDQVEFDVGCFNDLFDESEPLMNYGSIGIGTFDMFGHMSSMRNIPGFEPLLLKRRIVVREGVHKYFEDNAMMQLLSYENGDVKPFDRTEDEEVQKQHRYLFNFLFPLERYESLFMLQSNNIFDRYVEEKDTFYLTRNFVIQIIQQINNPNRSQPNRNSEVRDDELKETANNNIGNIPKLGNMFDRLGEMIRKLAPVTAAGAARNIANYSDPAYADMRKQYMEDPCDMSTGLVSGMVTPTPVKDFEYNLDKGFGKFVGGSKSGCKIYVPVNNMPSDLFQAIDFGDPVKTFRNIRKVVNLFVGLVTNREERYGYFIGPMGLIALNTMELPGEKHTKLREDKECPECDDPRKNLKPVIGLCEDR